LSRVGARGVFVSPEQSAISTSLMILLQSKLRHNHGSKLETGKRLQERWDTLLIKRQKQFSLFLLCEPFPQGAYRENCILETGYWHHAYGIVFAFFLDFEGSPFSIYSRSLVIVPWYAALFLPWWQVQGN